ncbi:MAG TPA: hypothetical protein VMF89_23610, partial [Polyangiales bacterium]|nr:hypothetical protein [Polyangiales bacterium]
LQAKRFEDELDLTEYCDAKLANVKEDQRESSPLCTEVATHSAETRKISEASLAQLSHDLL